MINGASVSAATGFTSEDESTVYRLAAGAFGVRRDDVGPESNPDTVKGWDSFAHIDFLVAVEKAFAVKLSPKEIMTVRKLGDVIAILRRKRG